MGNVSRCAVVAMTVIGAGAARATAAPASAAPAACIPAALAKGGLAGMDDVGGRARLCLSSSDSNVAPSCLLIDAAGTAVATVSPPGDPSGGDVPERDDNYHVELGAHGVYDVCKGQAKRCARIHTKHKHNEYLDKAGAVSDDGKLAFVLTTAEVHGDTHIVGELYDVRADKRLERVDITKIQPADASPEDRDGGIRDTSITHVEDVQRHRVIVGEYPAGPAGRSVLYDLDGKRGLTLQGYGATRLRIDDHTLVVVELGTAKVIDTKTFTVRYRVHLPGGSHDPDDPDPAGDTAATTLGTAVMIAYAAPFGTAMLDPATGALSAPQSLPMCKP